MGTSPRGYALTDKGERFVALMRAGVISTEGPAGKGRRGRVSSRPTCPVCCRFVGVTPAGFVRRHRPGRKDCRGTGLTAVTR